LSGPTLAVVDEGIGGNRVLNGALCCGVGAVARFARDVRDQPGARDVILLEGINDIGYSQSRGPLTAPHTDVSALQIVKGYERIITLAHTAGLKIFGATLTPFEGVRYWTPAGEAKRDAVNDWIRTSGTFDGVIDFAAAVADPGDPERLNTADDSGDHLHPTRRLPGGGGRDQPPCAARGGLPLVPRLPGAAGIKPRSRAPNLASSPRLPPDLRRARTRGASARHRASRPGTAGRTHT
jgi:GDSL-like Lipase/Acylhydrolase family